MRYTTVKEKEKIVAHKEIEEEIESAELRITSEEARKIASLLRYVVSLNTTVGLVSPTERRLAPLPVGEHAPRLGDHRLERGGVPR